ERAAAQQGRETHAALYARRLARGGAGWRL
ncbi:hypothetical protein BN1708_020068, partial [Verticillium longisporum]